MSDDLNPFTWRSFLGGLVFIALLVGLTVLGQMF